jgi:hypothetical protein
VLDQLLRRQSALPLELISTRGLAPAALQWAARQDFVLQLIRSDERGRRATFYTTGMEHSPTSATGTAWARTSWRATLRAAWEALRRSCESTIGAWVALL